MTNKMTRSLEFLLQPTVVDTSCFRHWYTNFGHTNLGVPKFNLKLPLNAIPLFWSNQQHNVNIITREKKNVIYSLFGLLNNNTGSLLYCVLLVKMLIWALFSQSMCTFSFCINIWLMVYFNRFY